MMDNHLFTDEQHGFVPGRSCMTQLLLVIEEWVDILVIYLDFIKTFDSVPKPEVTQEATGIWYWG